MNRKKFLAGSFAGISSAFISPSSLMSQTEEPLPYKLETVKEFVIAGHGNLQKVKEMLDEFPNLLYSSYDWAMEILRKLSKVQVMLVIKRFLFT